MEEEGVEASSDPGVSVVAVTPTDVTSAMLDWKLSICLSLRWGDVGGVRGGGALPQVDSMFWAWAR